MKRQINELLNERFVWEPEKLRLSDVQIGQELLPGRAARGKFTVSSPAGKTAQGFVYSTNSRVRCRPELFAGREETFYYEANTAGLREGELLEGAFVICETSGEYTLPYTFSIKKEEAGEDAGQPALTCEEFAALAREDFAKAYMMFASRQFPERIRDDRDGWLSLYQGLSGQSMSYHCLEQFLVGLGQKEPIEVRMEKERVCLDAPEENTREEVMLTKNTWGFAVLDISCDAPFITIERPSVTTEEFVGSTYSLGFVIQKDKLHAGRNFARITARAGCRTAECTVEVRKEPSVPGQSARPRRQEIARLLETYIRSRGGKIPVKEWCRQSLGILENLKKAGEDGIFFELYRSYLLFLSGRKVEAQMCLQETTGRKKELADARWKACYLYFTTFENKDKEYLAYVRREVQDLLLANREKWLIQWVVLHMMGGSAYRNDSERLDAVRQQYTYGCTSPVMYLEAYEILKKEPLMMRVLGDFEIHLLGFLAKEKLLNMEICGQAAQLASRAEYRPLLVRVLMACYRQHPGRNLLTAICSLLMKGHRNDAACAEWFRLGVEQDVRLAGLYEYYAQTAPDLNRRELPQDVRMYFSYNNTLDRDKKAAIYANILGRRREAPGDYETYRPAMERFMEEQLNEGQISEDLARLYETLLPRYTAEDYLLEGLSRVLFSCEVVCENPQIRHVIALHRRLADVQRVSLTGHKACVQKYSGDCRILLEDKDGVLYADRSLFSERMLLRESVLDAFCRSGKRLPASLLMHDLAGTAQVTEENAAHFVEYLSLPGLLADTRLEAQERLLLYYAENPRADVPDAFLDGADLDWLAQNHMRGLSELLVRVGRVGEAGRLIRKYGAEHVDTGTLVRLCSHSIEALGPGEDAELVALCAQCFARGTYDERILTYLMRWYEGPIGTMKELFAAGRRFLLEEFALEEKILAQALFMRDGCEGTEEIFAAYCAKQGKSWLCRAYAIWMSYCYFVRDMRVEQPVFDYIGRLYGQERRETGVPTVCQLALLRHICAGDKPDEPTRRQLYAMMEKFTAQGMYFRFYQDLPAGFLRRFQLHDKYILEYRADPESRVTLYYRLNGGKECAVPMNNTYEGIFTHVFTLFYQDKLEWRLLIERGREKKSTSPQTILCGKRAARGSTGRYELINRLAEAQQKGDEAQLSQIREQYIGQQYLVDELFQIN